MAQHLIQHPILPCLAPKDWRLPSHALLALVGQGSPARNRTPMRVSTLSLIFRLGLPRTIDANSSTSIEPATRQAKAKARFGVPRPPRHATPRRPRHTVNTHAYRMLAVISASSSNAFQRQNPGIGASFAADVLRPPPRQQTERRCCNVCNVRARGWAQCSLWMAAHVRRGPAGLRSGPRPSRAVPRPPPRTAPAAAARAAAPRASPVVVSLVRFCRFSRHAVSQKRVQTLRHTAPRSSRSTAAKPSCVQTSGA